MRISLLAVLIVSVLFIAACSEQDRRNNGFTGKTSNASGSDPSADAKPIKREYKFSKVMFGANLFQKNCAGCHGEQAEGAYNWRQVGADGKYPPPPLNGTGHAWHHPKNALIYTIKNGTIPLGGGMPAWQSKLTDEEIEAILAWVISRWSDDIYQRWASRQLELRRSSQ